MKKLAGMLLGLIAFAPMTEARVHAIKVTQSLELPQAVEGEGFPAIAVAIEGNSMIAIVDRAAGRMALMYRRGTDGVWTYNRTLLQSTAPMNQRRASVAMKNYLAVIDIEGVTTIWRKSGGQWTQNSIVGDTHHAGGVAITDQRVLVGASGCDADGLIHEETAPGAWSVTGRIPPGAGVCADQERDLDVNGGYALIRGPGDVVRAYRRNGTAMDWVAAGSFTLQGTSAGRGGIVALQKEIAVAPGSAVYRRSGTTWTHISNVVPIDGGINDTQAEKVVYRDSVLVTLEGRDPLRGGFARPYLYAPDASGRFRNIAILDTPASIHDVDISGLTMVATGEDLNGVGRTLIYELPSPLVPSSAIANDFNAGDVSGFQQTLGTGFAVAGNIYDRTYRQSSTAGENHTTLTASNWNYYETLRVRVRANAFSSGESWVGAALRYVDADNFYYVALLGSHRLQINRRLNGVTTTLGEGFFSIPVGEWRDIWFNVDGQTLSASLAGDAVTAYDTSFTRGRAALLTHRARADFDDLYVSPTLTRTLLFKNYFGGADVGPPLAEFGGTWVVPPSGITGRDLRQTDSSGLALAVGGTPVDDLWLTASLRLDAFATPTNPVPWIGLVARFVDVNNYYYLSIRGSNQLQIRKMVNGAVSVLDAAAFTLTPGQVRGVQFRVQGNQLHAVVDGVVLATATDDDLPEGRYGIGTYRATARFRSLTAIQP